mmetsp:Transcript_35343/g.40885  ORF Transcript_35343/g.40885 Transcript_35343/m.40885 type:complete len:91 (+) Transcript_35343:2230-2502(+)
MTSVRKNAGPPLIHLINKRVNAAAVKVDYVDGLQQNFGFVGKSVTLIAAWMQDYNPTRPSKMAGSILSRNGSRVRASPSTLMYQYIYIPL